MTRPPLSSRASPFLARFTSSDLTRAAIACLAVAAALGEETLFRAAIQPLAGIVIASALFTLAHALIADFRHPTSAKEVNAVLAFGMGLLPGVLYERLGIAASMAAHAAFDAAALWFVRPTVRAGRLLST